jgi:hypothetical protein
MEVQVGQFWKENDSRFTTVKEVLGVAGDKVKLQTVESSSGKTGKRTYASIKRFNGKSGGYSYLPEYKGGQHANMGQGETERVLREAQG